MNGRWAAAARGEIARVAGDGKSTIRELIDAQLNTDPRRGLAEECPLSPILLDVEPAVRLELQRQGYDGESVPTAGKEVIVQRNGNMNFDVTGIVHPSIAAAGELAARIVGLDIAGIDFVADDITLPLDRQQATVGEVNAGPSLLMHLKPEFGAAQPVGEAIVDSLFPDGESGRIPIVGVTGTDGMTLVAQIAAWIIHLSGRHVGLACGDGLYFERRHVEKHDCAPWQAGHRVLLNRAVEAAVFENGCRMILAEGLAYDRCQVGVVTGIATAAGLEDHDIRELDQVYNVVRTQVDVVLPEGTAVLNASDPMVAKMASLCDGEVIFFGVDPAVPTLAEHRSQGGRAVFVRDGHIVLATGGSEVPLTQLAAVPVAGRQAEARVEHILAAIGSAWALRIGDDLIRTGIETFQPDVADPSPQRQEPSKAATTAWH